MKLSILLITYNQSKYIEQCLDSISMQKAEIEIEIVVADDCSTDNTAAIIRQYAERSLFKFIFLPTTNNLGFVKNYQRAFNACTGNYIAVMEGDDYWTDPSRLTKHVQFLEQHLECVMTMNRYIMRNEFSNSYSVIGWTSPDMFEYVNGHQMAIENRLGNMSACVFRTSEIRKIKPDMFDMPIADWLIGMVLCEYGPIAVLNDCMSVYRIHKNGQWSKMNEKEQLEKMNELMEKYDQYLEHKYHHEFTLHKRRLNGAIEPPVPIAGYSIRDFLPPVILRMFKK